MQKTTLANAMKPTIESPTYLMRKFLKSLTLAKELQFRIRHKLTLASLLFARILGPYSANTHGTRVSRAP